MDDAAHAVETADHHKG